MMNMMITERQNWKTISPSRSERHHLASLLHFSPYVHRHLDWRSPLEWLGSPAFVALREADTYLAALACSPETEQVAWVRLFVVSQQISPHTAWEALFPAAEQHLPSGTILAALPLQSWFQALLTQQGFEPAHQVIMLEWEKRDQALDISIPPGYRLRWMNYDDLEAVQAIDAAAFEPVWQHSPETLQRAFQSAALASVIEDEEGIVAYQLSTISGSKGHLARLAVHPRAQRQGIGQTLLHSLLAELLSRGIYRVTVNTQDSNAASLALYRHVGFRETGEAYPVLIRRLE